MQSDISFGCPSCGATFLVSGEHAGRIARCRKCDNKIRIPKANSVQPDPTSPSLRPEKSEIQPETLDTDQIQPHPTRPTVEPPPLTLRAEPTPPASMKQVDQDHGPKLVGTDQETRSQLSHEIGNPPSPDASNNKSKSWWERDEVVWPILAGVIGISFVVGMIQGKTTYVLLRVVKYVVLFAAIPGLGLLTQRYPALSSIGKSLMFFMLALVVLFTIWIWCFAG